MIGVKKKQQKPISLKMRLSKYYPILWYLGIVTFIVYLLIKTTIAYTIPFSVPTVIGIATAILGFTLNLKNTTKEKKDEVDVKKNVLKKIQIPNTIDHFHKGIFILVIFNIFVDSCIFIVGGIYQNVHLIYLMIAIILFLYVKIVIISNVIPNALRFFFP